MKLQEYLDVNLLNKMIDLGYVLVNKHPNVDLYILNYSKICPIDKMWNDVTEKCRGLIIDSEGNIKARPFRKFYNYEEIEDKSIIPNLPFDIYEKLDGSLGILYWVDNTPYIATRGSFVSDQAIHATEILHSKLRHVWSRLDKRKTYLFEIIYPEDLHVITYKGVDNIFLLAVIDTETGEEESPYNYKGVFSVAEHYSCWDWRKVRDYFDGTNREGFVVRFSNNFRLKLKYAEYFELHHILYGLSENKIFEFLRDDKLDDLYVIINKLPEPQKVRINYIINQFIIAYNIVKMQCINDFRSDFETRKEAAEYFKTCKYPQVMFAMLDGKDITSYIWKIIAKER